MLKLQAEKVSQAREQTPQQQAESGQMAAALHAWRDSPEGAQWQKDRARLPVLAIRPDLLTQLAQHDVVVVSGDTGCGKTTQVLSFVSFATCACMHACPVVQLQRCMLFVHCCVYTHAD